MSKPSEAEKKVKETFATEFEKGREITGFKLYYRGKLVKEG